MVKVRRVRKPQQELFVNASGKAVKAHGGKRRRSGRKVTPGREQASEAHRMRERFRRTTPIHVVMRVDRTVGSLRNDTAMYAIREALITLAKRDNEFRVIHLSVQRKHVHLLVEANNNLALSRGMQAFGISAARHLNRELGRTGGTVFPDRYHATRLGSPRQVRNCIAYVLNNWRHHNEDRRVAWRLDPFSSSVMFDGWRDRHFNRPPGYVAPLVLEPTTWLLRIGWRKRGLIDPDEIPGS
jgi:putative transposase